ncbi:TetR/AcrR family transcriptional regulator [Levilactobacillus brevis]|uniref:TetR/AcrR family transcriptional regulator n=1 Tax=Levilactobacillus brevis TaxID=1580 RepID=UPI001C1EF014|nr:TetR family transcriptional regulator [Levilactobacillus brevis]MBU7540063.1 TetR/AcrR family transcriptional regulator [Levilactobacillus brevis]MBU7559602.1 TetR/AcrR family transcriptional regulator [Levilactobacillus brevis]MBU7566187.1 TetR/AcrR family transcriptional regulator [Levilactobacillus brevis]MCE6011176.1 TetR/AcrR family transcriptional regulator [Levilactobacillus brevis]MCE6013467.1 TetR/AcrR family transcriptional regulator [Levilactobacillus brevis]
MVKRRTLTREKVLDQANELIADQGLNQLTIRALATKLSVRPQSIYNYVNSLNDLLDQVGLRFVNELNDALMRRLVGVSGKEALFVFAREFRRGCKQQDYLAPLLMNPDDLRHLERTHIALIDLYKQMFTSLHLDEKGATGLVESTLYRSALFGFIVQEIGGFIRLPEAQIDERFERTMQLAIDQFTTID